MDLFPAIDLRGGAVVRLLQGDRARETRYASDPVDVVREFEAQGARWLHAVNLDGAFREGAGEANGRALEKMLQARGALKVQIGGGLRTLDDMARLLDQGAARVILGSVAVQHPERIDEAIARFGAEAIAVGIDARGGVRAGDVKTHGWTQGGALTPLELAERVASQGVQCVIYTNIAHDGMGDGPDVDGALTLAREAGLSVIISGGVGNAGHLRACAARAHEAAPGRVEGVIAGKALHDGALTVAEALDALR